MNDAIKLLEKHVLASMASSMDDSEFGRYASEHPSVWSIVGTVISRPERDLTEAILASRNFPDESDFKTSGKGKYQLAMEVDDQFMVLARFFVEAGRRFGFTLFGEKPLKLNGKKPSGGKTMEASSLEEAFDSSASKTSLKKPYVKDEPRYVGKGIRYGRVRYLKGSDRKRVDKALREKGTTLYQMMERQRKGEFSYAALAEEIHRLTGKRIHATNLQNLGALIRRRRKTKRAMKVTAKRAARVASKVTFREGTIFDLVNKVLLKKGKGGVVAFYHHRRNEGVDTPTIARELKKLTGITVNTGNFWHNSAFEPAFKSKKK